MAAITDLATLTGVADGDYLVVSDTSDSATDKKITRANLLGSTTATFAPTSTTENGIVINMPASNTANAIAWRYNGGSRVILRTQATYTDMVFDQVDGGAGVGPYITLSNNSNATTPAAGHVRMQDKGGTTYRVWPDDSGNLRIGTSDPTNANDTSGTVIGAQTSSLSAKNITGEPLLSVDVLAAVQAGADAVRRFTYRDGSFNGEEFSGVVVDYAPRYGMDRDADHPAGKSLNVVTVIGDLLLAVANLAERVAVLEAAQNG